MGRAAIHPPDGPGRGRRIVGAQRRASRVARGAVEQAILDIAEPAQDRPRIRSALELVPLAARTLDAVMHVPVAELEVEIVGAGEVVGGERGLRDEEEGGEKS